MIYLYKMKCCLKCGREIIQGLMYRYNDGLVEGWLHETCCQCEECSTPTTQHAYTHPKITYYVCEKHFRSPPKYLKDVQKEIDEIALQMDMGIIPFDNLIIQDKWKTLRQYKDILNNGCLSTK